MKSLVAALALMSLALPTLPLQMRAETLRKKAVLAEKNEDAEFWTHGAAPLIGRAALAKAFEPFLSTYSMDQPYEAKELIISGDWAFLRGMETNRLIPLNSGEPLTRHQRAFSLLRRQSDGTWLFARGMTNLPPQD